MKFLLWLLMVDILVVLTSSRCLAEDQTDNWMSLRQRRHPEHDNTPARKKITRKIKPVKVLPLRDVTKQRKANFMSNKDLTANLSDPAPFYPNDKTYGLISMVRPIKARKQLVNGQRKYENGRYIQNRRNNDLDNNIFKENNMKEKGQTILNALNPDENKTDLKIKRISTNKSNPLDELILLNKKGEETLNPKLVKDYVIPKTLHLETIQPISPFGEEYFEKLGIPEITNDTKLTGSVTLTLEEKKLESEQLSNVDEHTNAKNENKMKNPSIKDLLRQDQTSEVVTPNHYDRMYSKSLQPFFYTEKYGNKKDEKNNLESNELIELNGITTEDSMKTNQVNKDYVTKLFKLETLPSVLSKTEVKLLSDDIKPKLKAENRECLNPPFVEPHTVGRIDLRLPCSSEVTATPIDPNELTSLYLEKHTVDEYYEPVNKVPANYDVPLENAPLCTPCNYDPAVAKATISNQYNIKPKRDQYNRLYYDCSTSNITPVIDSRPYYEGAMVTNGYGNLYSRNGNTQFYNKNNQRNVDLGNGRYWRFCKITKMHFIKNGAIPKSVYKTESGVIPFGCTNQSPIVYKTTLEPVVTSCSYKNQIPAVYNPYVKPVTKPFSYTNQSPVVTPYCYTYLSQ